MKKYEAGLYISIETHDGVHDYEFAEGEVLNMQYFHRELDDDIYFAINNVDANCSDAMFAESFVKLDTSSAWFAFRDAEYLYSDSCYDVLCTSTGEVIMTREAEDLIQLSDITYNADEDTISGVVTYITEEDMFPEIRNDYTRVTIARCAVTFVGY